MLVHGEDEIGAVFSKLGAEATGGAGARGGEVGLDDREGGAAFEAAVQQLGEADVHVGVEASETLLGPAEKDFAREFGEELTEGHPEEHERRQH